MKKIILLLSLITCVSTNCFSQKTSAGVKAGVNFSNLSNAGNTEALTGFTGGVFFVHSIVEHFGVSAELLYSGEGAKNTFEQSVGNSVVRNENRLRLNYLRIPLLANVFFGQLGDQLRPKLILGPSFGFLLGAKNVSRIITTEGSSVSETEHVNTDKDSYSGFDIGAIIGAGLNYKAGERTWLNLDARYHIGASDINEVKLQNGDAVKNNVFSVSVGLAFGLTE
jgi:hypothetical protein